MRVPNMAVIGTTDMIRNFESWAAYIADRQAMPFAWGTHDCVIFAAGAIHALTGNDPLAGIVAWDSERSALQRLAEFGGLVPAVSSVLRPIAPAHAHRGDIAAVDGPGGQFLMVVEGMTLVGPGQAGLDRLPREHMVLAWCAQ